MTTPKEPEGAEPMARAKAEIESDLVSLAKIRKGLIPQALHRDQDYALRVVDDWSAALRRSLETR